MNNRNWTEIFMRTKKEKIKLNKKHNINYMR